MNPSPQQQAILEAIRTGDSNLLIQACAGAGKTTTLRMIAETISLYNPGLSIGVFAFNKDIADDFKTKFPASVDCRTLHSHGMKAIRFSQKSVKVEKDKSRNIIKFILQCNGIKVEEIGERTSEVDKLVGIVFNSNLDPTNVDAIQAAADLCGYIIKEQDNLRFVAPAVAAMDADVNTINFDEMISRPVRMNMSVYQYDVVLLDESQDLNPTQMLLVEKSVRHGGRIVAVGDRWQSIYGFRGADPDSMDKIKAYFNMAEKPLSVTYRCPNKVVTEAQKIVGEGIIEAKEDAADGEVVWREEKEFHDLPHVLESGDMVLCRVCAPLMPQALRCLRLRKKAVVAGRDIGTGLAALIKSFKVTTIDQLMKKLDKWLEKETNKALKRNNQSALIVINDKHDMIAELASECLNVKEVVDLIYTLFTDKTEQGIVFSTIHKAKGLEAETVYILAPELMPHPLSFKAPNQQVAVQQEKNMQYVAVTRALHKLVYQPMPDERDRD